METKEERRTRLENDAEKLATMPSFKHDVLNIDHELLSASFILLDMYLITYTL